jgi:hypothetical protein
LKYINRGRKKKDLLSKEITMEEWEEYFMKLLESRKDEQSMERRGVPSRLERGRNLPYLSGRDKQSRKLPRNNSPEHGISVVSVSFERKDDERDRGKGSGAGQASRIQKGKGHYGQYVHPGPFTKERAEEEREEDVRTVRRLEGGVGQGGQKENVLLSHKCFNGTSVII